MSLLKSRFIEMFGDVINNKKTWPTKRWSDVLNIVNGKNQKKVECENGIYPICGSGGKIGKTNEYLTKENSVIIGRKGNINNPILMKTKFWNVDTAFGLEPNNKEINVEYLYKFCELFDFQRLNKTVTIPSLTKSDLLKIEIPVPPMKLQEEYRNFLAQVDKSKFLLQQILEKFELLKKSRFIEMFKNSETLRLDQIAEVTMGQSPDSSSYNSVGKGIPFYQGKTEFTDKYIGQPSTWCTSPTRIAKENDILMSVRAPVGNVNIATEECCIGRGLSSIRPQNGFNSEFIFEALEQKKEELENKATGSTFKAINKDIVLSIQIPNTSISIQKEYSNFVKQIDKSKFNVFQDQTASQVKVIVVLHHIC